MAKVPDDIIYGRTALREGVPWIVPEALTYLQSIVQPTWAVFEWGAGGSTVYFARHCAVVTTIEQGLKWYADIGGKVAQVAGSAVSIRYIPIEPDNDHYADAILDFKDEVFDLVSVDGEATKRDRCMENTWAKVVPGGYIMLDNSNWWHGSVPPGWTRVDFMETGLHWVGMKEPFDWATSFFQRPLSASDESEGSSERNDLT